MNKNMFTFLKFVHVLFLLITFQLISSYFSIKAKAFSSDELVFRIERGMGFIPAIEQYNSYSWMVKNAFSADSGTGNIHSGILNISLKSDTSSIDTLYLYFEKSFFLFKSLPGTGKQNPFPNYTQNGTVYNIKKDNIFDLELLFKPPNTMNPGYYTCNLWLYSKELNDSGYVRIEIPVMILYNPYEWFDFSKKPGIELSLISNKKDTSNLIFGSGYNSTFRDDTIYGEYPYYYPLTTFGARFYLVDEEGNALDYLIDEDGNFLYSLQYGLGDFSPNDENMYSNSRDIKNFNNDSMPIFFHAKLYSKYDDYPIKIEYDDFNFPEDALFIMSENLGINPKFKFDMRTTPKINSSRHQFIISDTSIKEFYIIYYRKKPLGIVSNSITTENKIQIIPNPVTNNLTVIFQSITSTDADLTLYNVFGAKIFEINNINITPGTNEIPVILNDNCSEGVYFINIKTLTENYTKKILIIDR
jgi:hypothetical protein